MADTDLPLPRRKYLKYFSYEILNIGAQEAPTELIRSGGVFSIHLAGHSGVPLYFQLR